MSAREPSPEPLVWTPELVSRFWDGVASAGLDDALAFGRMAKRCILWVIGRHLVRGGRHLDYGAGTGEVAAYLIEHGFPFAILEPSAARQRRFDDRLASLPGFLGTPSAADAGSYDAVTCFEVLEHVLDDRFEAVCDEIAGYVRPGGRLIVSTPNNENLALSTVYCPISNKTFHRWQHVRRILPEALEQIFARRGFRKLCIHQLAWDESLFLPYLHMMGLTESGEAIPTSIGWRERVPRHVQQILEDLDGVMGGANGLLYVGVKSGPAAVRAGEVSASDASSAPRQAAPTTELLGSPAPLWAKRARAAAWGVVGAFVFLSQMSVCLAIHGLRSLWSLARRQRLFADRSPN